MKRYGADKDNDMRKRTEPEGIRPSGPLTDDEIEEVRQAYRDGCQGEVIIGMRGNERVVTMLVPAHPDENEWTLLRQKLRQSGCNSALIVNRTCSPTTTGVT